MFGSLTPYWDGFFTALAIVVASAALVAGSIFAYVGFQYLQAWRMRGAWSDQ